MNDTLNCIDLFAAVPEAILLLSCPDHSFLVAYFVCTDGSVVILPASAPPNCIIKDTFSSPCFPWAQLSTTLSLDNRKSRIG